MDAAGDLRLLLVSRHPLILARADDEARFMSYLKEATGTDFALWTWSSTRGLSRDGLEPQANTQTVASAMGFIAEIRGPGVFVFHDAEPVLEEHTSVRAIKERALEATPEQTIVLTGPTISVPDELKGLALLWKLAPPSHAEVQRLVAETMEELRVRHFAEVDLPSERIRELEESLRGLSLLEAQRLILRAALEDGSLDAHDLPQMREAKAGLLAEDGILSLVPTEEGGLDRVGGLDRLKDWLAVRGRGFSPEAKDYGLDAPRGVLLLGVPGCGKSLVAKTLARSWGMPLVSLDSGAIFGSFVGESEGRLRRALLSIESMAPVVVWVDEIEKGFAASASARDGGVGQRVLGGFLRWLQERHGQVFLVATCNDVESLPPELLRRGRFDEVFFVDLPGPVGREAILRLHLERRRRDPASFDLADLASRTDGFSGAELEGVVVGALYRAFAAGEELDDGFLQDEAELTAPLSRTRAEDIARLRAWSEGRAVPAGPGSRADG
jgi:ATPase family protein associated with various cellular activities (AAA)/AAA+ lid domain-containing protein